MKIRIFTLAKELNMDSKVLIGYCQKVGITIKDSPLASISEEERDRVLECIRQGGAASSEAPSKGETLAPTREPARAPGGGKVAAMKSLAPRPQIPRETRREPAPETPSAPVPEPVIEAPSPAAAEVVEAPVEAAAPPVTVPVVEPAPHVPVTSPAPAAASADEETTDESEGLADDESIVTPRIDDGGGPVAPLRREDYTPASGAIRAMVPRGNVSQLGTSAPRRQKSRPMPQLPKLAEPPPSPKAPAGPSASAEGPAQKPEMRLSRELLEGKPLHEHIRQHAEEKKRKATGDDFGEEASEETKRPGVKGGVRTPAAAGMGLLSERKQRQAKRTRVGGAEDDDDGGSRMRQHRSRSRRGVGGSAPLKTSAEIELPVSVRALSEAMGRRANELLAILARRGQMVTINATLDEETALDVALECGVDLQIVRERDIEEELAEAASAPAEEATRQGRPPIVTILGHVDHGKTTLLDKIRSANVAAGEVGGITQHIAAYQVEHNGQKITFLDTPGHAAFAEMRARGANVTDIAVLVVAANDGVMPQTIEALNHARAAEVPIVVALNKIDLPEKNEQRVLQDLAGQNLLAAEWGGDTEVVRTSGATGQGIDDLLETLLTVAELRELSSDPTRPASGICLEAFLDEGRGVLAWLIVQDGTLRKGDVILCGPAFGRIRNMYDEYDREIEVAGPSTPVKVAGLDLVPGAGDRFFMLDDLEKARQAAELRRAKGREKQLSQRGKVRTLQEILSTAETGGVQDLPLILKADTPGSLEALKGEILKFQHPEVRCNVLHEAVGGVNESDVYLASASGAIVVAFHVVPEDRAETLADREGVEIRQYGIIYEVTDDIKKALEGLLRPEKVETATGRAVVLQTFDISRFGRIAGCRVLNGTIERTNRVRVIRDQKILNEYGIASLKRNKDDAREVRDGLECGIRLDGFDDVKPGDIFQAFKIEEVKRTL